MAFNKLNSLKVKLLLLLPINKMSMKKNKLLLLILFVSVFVSAWRAQTCTVGFNYTLGVNGSITFSNISTPTTSPGTFTLNFGVPYLPPQLLTATTSANVTYTNPGNYIVTLSASNCPQQFTANVVIPTCTVTLNSSSATGSLCNGSISSLLTGFCGVTTYSWSNGGSGPVQSSLCAGFYSVVVAGSNPSCCPTASAFAFVNSVPPCSISASFVHSVQANGLVTFSSTSTGTNPSSQFFWNFGDVSPTGSGSVTSHQYASPGTYSATLKVNNGSFACQDSTNNIPITPLFCNLNSTIVSNYVPASGAYNFTCLSSGASTTAVYNWNFGDGNTASGNIVSHNYTGLGPYTVTVVVSTFSPNCSNTATTTIVLPCQLSANFSHTLGANGNVAFTNLSASNSGTLSYLWDFGDGYGDIAANPFHQYSNAGTHYVSLRAYNSNVPACYDSLTMAINITGLPCNPNAGFYLTAGTSPQFWYAIPYYPYNVLAASWNWGDGSSSNTLLTSHTYSTAGNYTICLTVTVSCNASTTYCYSQYLNKTEAGSGPVTINVKLHELALGIENGDNNAASNGILLWPNPATTEFQYSAESEFISIKISDISGREIYSVEHPPMTAAIPVENIEPGYYIVTFETTTTKFSKKILINQH